MSPANGEQIHLVNYVEDYLDSIESLPFDLQRNVSLMREIDAKYQGKAVMDGRGRPRLQGPRAGRPVLLHRAAGPAGREQKGWRQRSTEIRCGAGPEEEVARGLLQAVRPERSL